MPVSLTLIEAIAGRDKAQAVARDLGLTDWDARHASDAFVFTRPFALTAMRNTLAFWNYEQLGLELVPGVDEVSLALVADAWSRTSRSHAVTFAGTAGAQQTRNGIGIFPDQVAASWPAERLIPALGAGRLRKHWIRPFTQSRRAMECTRRTSSPCSSNTRGQRRRNKTITWRRSSHQLHRPRDLPERQRDHETADRDHQRRAPRRASPSSRRAAPRAFRRATSASSSLHGDAPSSTKNVVAAATVTKNSVALTEPTARRGACPEPTSAEVVDRPPAAAAARIEEARHEPDRPDPWPRRVASGAMSARP